MCPHISPEELPDGSEINKEVATEDWLPAIDADLTPPQKQEVLDVLRDSPPILSKTPGQTHLAVHRIPTPEGTVIRNRWRLLPQAQWEMVRREVEDMLRLGVIEPSHSAWRSLLVLVPKLDESIRFCVDYREVHLDSPV